MSSNYSTNDIQFANANPNNGISLCIPHVFNNIPAHRIKAVFIRANLGFVERVDIVTVKDQNYSRAFIHFAPKKWNMRSTLARRALTQLQAGETLVVEYQSPYFWNATISNCPRPTDDELLLRTTVRIVPRRINPTKRRIVIDIDDSSHTHTSKESAFISTIHGLDDEDLSPSNCEPITARILAAN